MRGVDVHCRSCILYFFVLILVFCHSPLFAEEKGANNDNQQILQQQLLEQDEKKGFEIAGFMDVQYRYMFFNSKKKNVIKDHNFDKQHFNVNNINLYLKFNIHDYWVAFTEIGFVYAPTGMFQYVPVDIGYNNTIDFFMVTPISNSYYDNQLVNMQYGSITIERAYIEWNKYQFFNIRAGHYLTPFGIWSQDHGSPVLTSIRVPATVSYGSPVLGFPRSQTGIDLLGRIAIKPIDLLIDYAAYLGNGAALGPDTVADEFDGEFSFGAFLNFRMPPIAKRVDIDYGAAYYRGKRTAVSYQYADAHYVTDNPSNPSAGNTMVLPNFDSKKNKYIIRQLDNIMNVHFKLHVNTGRIGSMIIQFEYIRQWVKEYRQGLIGYLSIARTADTYIFHSLYAQIEFQFLGWITPYFRYEWALIDTLDTFLSSTMRKPSLYIVGLNLKIIPRVVLKLEYNHALLSYSKRYYEFDNNMSFIGAYRPNNNFQIVQASLSVAF